MTIQTVAGLGSLLRYLRKVIRLYLKYKPGWLDKLNPAERAALEKIEEGITALLDEFPIPDE
jgi:hypothetical protein